MFSPTLGLYSERYEIFTGIMTCFLESTRANLNFAIILKNFRQGVVSWQLAQVDHVSQNFTPIWQTRFWLGVNFYILSVKEVIVSRDTALVVGASFWPNIA